ncbi:exodeoxyribonuclease V subunit alpha [Lentisphaera marina]|uniref:exodeoxyribonuclease V subunit alpha n=1 Tax=Lentisphaera marina TaxID=1111041 RepID=UPI00236581AF|nr:exodeoxyribonuclease V subunit alpha [Lentisphaera marina]MDD7986673.1 exodeoxyribonuclease V subunit alpha [Lentisphaera marina]
MSKLKELKIFSDIDRHFSEFICEKQADLNEENKNLLEELAICLSYYANQQHSVLPLSEIKLDYSDEEEKHQAKVLSFQLTEADLNKFNRVMGTDADPLPLILDLDNQFLYLNKYYRAEKAVADFIRETAGQTEIISSELTEQVNKVFENTVKNTGAINWQKIAAFMALRSRFCVISGGPGTGKTTTVGKILALLLEQNPSTNIDLVAPTGKAADRLGGSIRNFINSEESSALFDPSTLAKIPDCAQTIHRYLGFNPGGGFKHNTQNKTASDILLIDESSMVPLILFRSIIDALQSDCRVILLGDKDQLAAVETGNVLGDLTSGESINAFSQTFNQQLNKLNKHLDIEVEEAPSPLQDIMVKLEHSFRFDADSGIGNLARDVNDCPHPHPLEDLGYFDQYQDIELLKLPEKVENLLKNELLKDFNHYKNLVQKSTAKEAKQILEALNKFRILCAGRNGYFGSENLNEMISKKIFKCLDDSLYLGRAIMITRNDYGISLFNGDIGVILEDDDQLPKAYFTDADGEVRAFPPSVLPDYETAFAMTIHKSQGSEYKNVYLLLSDKSERLLGKELIYTGITRAKEKVTLYSDHAPLLQACKKVTKRHSGLSLRIENQ